MKIKKYKIEFVDTIPKKLKEGILYICINCNVIVHKCACGCGEKTVTPLDRNNGWIMKYDGQSITLRPSIGNFSFNCKSHYYITENKVDWLNDNACYNNNKVEDLNIIQKIINFVKSMGKNRRK
ncbi:MAG: DUF6527 family protein [Clostridia bacterium]